MKWGSLTALLSLAAFAQQGAGPDNGGFARGNFLRVPDYKTTGVLAFFVDPTGSDSNNCTSAATPCQTVTGVSDKIPKLIRNPVTVTFANGNYTGGWFRGFKYDPLSTSTAGAYIALVGNLVSYTPATGNPTGTATSSTVCAVNPIVKSTLTDTTQTWTANNLTGFLLHTTGGTGSGQYMPVASNTGTTATLAGCWGVQPDATTTYELLTWGANITTGVFQPGDYLNSFGTGAGLGFENIDKGTSRSNTDGFVFIDSLRVNVGAFEGLWVSNTHAYVRRSRFDTSGSTRNAIDLRGPGPRLTFANSVATAVNAYAFFEASPEINGTSNPSIGSATQIINSYFQSANTNAFGAGVNIDIPGFSVLTSTLTMTSAASPYAVFAQGLPVAGILLGFFVNCTAGGSTVGFSMVNGTNSNPTIPSSVMSIMYDSGEVSECSTAFQLSGANVLLTTDDSIIQATAGTTAISVSTGSQVQLDTNTVTSGSFTNELSFDNGAVTATFTDARNTQIRVSGSNSGVVSIP